MSISVLTTELPLLIAGLPRAVTESLLVAGVPHRIYRTGSSFRDFLQDEPGRFVLYDSRKITSRLEAETALNFERDILDIAPESGSGIGILSDDERDWIHAAPIWIEHLKFTLLAKGELWLRVHDLPARDEGVVFADGLPDEDLCPGLIEHLTPLPAANNRVPGPHFGFEHVLDDATLLSQPTLGCWWAARGVGPSEFGARTWFPARGEFERWWTYRNALRVGLRQTAFGIELSAEGFDPAAPAPIVEYWRNEHVARIPVAAARMTIAHENLVFAREPFRHPAGLLVSQGRAEIPASGIAGRHSAPLLKTW